MKAVSKVVGLHRYRLTGCPQEFFSRDGVGPLLADPIPRVMLAYFSFFGCETLAFFAHV